jgi:hypothetical protein
MLTINIESVVQSPAVVLPSNLFPPDWQLIACIYVGSRQKSCAKNCNRVENRNVIRGADFIIDALAYIYPMSIRYTFAWGSLIRQGNVQITVRHKIRREFCQRECWFNFLGGNFFKQSVDSASLRELCWIDYWFSFMERILLIRVFIQFI